MIPLVRPRKRRDKPVSARASAAPTVVPLTSPRSAPPNTPPLRPPAPSEAEEQLQAAGASTTVAAVAAATGRRRPARARTALALTPTPGTPVPVAVPSATAVVPAQLALKRSRSSNARLIPRRHNKRDSECAVGYVLERLGTDEAETPSPPPPGSVQRRRPRSSRQTPGTPPTPPMDTSLPSTPGRLAERPSRGGDKTRARTVSGLVKRNSTGGNGNGVGSFVGGCAGGAVGGGGNGRQESGGGGTSGASSSAGGGSGGGNGVRRNGGGGGRRNESNMRVLLQNVGENKLRSPRAMSPRAQSPLATQRNSSRAPSPGPNRTQSPAKRLARNKAARRSSKLSAGSRRHKRTIYTYQLLQELALSPRRGGAWVNSGSPGTSWSRSRTARVSSAHQPLWRAPNSAPSKASMARLSRLGSRSSVGSGRRRRCRSSRPARHRAQPDLYALLSEYVTPPGERRRAESRTRSPARNSSRSPSNASVMYAHCHSAQGHAHVPTRCRRHRERAPTPLLHKTPKRSKSRRRKLGRAGSHRSRKSRSRGSIGSSMSSRYSRVYKGKRSAAAKARAKARRHSGQGRRSKRRDPTFALENILEFLEPPKGENKALAKAPPPLVVRPSPPPTPRVSTGRLSSSADFMLPDTATVIHDVLQELQGPKAQPPTGQQVASKPCVSAADIREKLASTSSVLGETPANNNSQHGSTSEGRSRTSAVPARRSTTDVPRCQLPSSSLLLDTLRQMCNTPSRFVMQHRRRVPRSEREWAMGAAQKVGNLSPWTPPKTSGNSANSSRISSAARNLIPQAWLGPKFPPPKSHLKSTRSSSARSSSFTSQGASAAAIAAATLAASAPSTPGAAYGGGPVTVCPIKPTTKGVSLPAPSNLSHKEPATLATYTASLAPPAPPRPTTPSNKPRTPVTRSPSTPAPTQAPATPAVSNPPTPTTTKVPQNVPAPRLSAHQLGNSGVRPLMRALSAHACAALRRVPSGKEARRPPTDVLSALNLSPSSSSTSSRYRRRRRRIIGARPTQRDPVSAVQLFAQLPHPLWPPMAAVRRKGGNKQQPLSNPSLPSSASTTEASAPVLSAEPAVERRPLRSCLKGASRRPMSAVRAVASDSQFGGVGEGTAVPVESPLMRFQN